MYHRRGPHPLWPVPPRRPSRGGAATPPRPAPPQQGSPGVPAPRPWLLGDFAQRSADLPPRVLCLGWGARGGTKGGSEFRGLGRLRTHIYPLQHRAHQQPCPYRNLSRARPTFRLPGPTLREGRIQQSRERTGLGICVLNKCQAILMQAWWSPLRETALNGWRISGGGGGA